MADLSHAFVVNATLTGTTVDVVTLTRPAKVGRVINRAALDGADIWVTIDNDAADQQSPGDPTVAGTVSLVVPPGQVRTFWGNGRGSTVVRLLGSGNAYSVEGDV